MTRLAVPTVFMRGGTSKGLFFHRDDLPEDEAARDRFLLAAIGSPDPYGRQLDGMGGGVSSLSKAMIIAPSERPGVDVDYLFAQVAVDEPLVDYRGNCGNLSAAVAAFALDAGLVAGDGDQAVVRMYNQNTDKVVTGALTLEDGARVEMGEMEIAGVAGSAAPIRLDFHDPGGAGTGRLLPTGSPRDSLRLPDGEIDVSFVDAANPCAFIRAADLGMTGAETPAVLRADAGLMARLENIRAAAAVAAGMCETVEEATQASPGVPKVAMVGPPADQMLLSGEMLSASECDVTLRMISLGAPHLAAPLTGAMCTAVAAEIDGSVVAEFARFRNSGGLRIATPSGVLPVDADVADEDGWVARSATVYRTARRLMAGEVYAHI